MPTPILMPALSPTMTEGRLSKWNKTVGQAVQSGDLLMDVETDKAVMEVEATQEGILDLIVIPGETDAVKVGQIVAVLRSDDEESGSGQKWLDDNGQHPEQDQSARDEKGQGDASIEAPASSHAAPDNISVPGVTNRIIASPLAKKIAQDKGLDLSHVRGSGPRGRILKRDVEQVSSPCLSKDFVHSLNEPCQTTRRDLTPMRKSIAKRLTQSKTTVPHFYLSVECHMDELLKLRIQMNSCEKIFSINDFMVRACALALDAVPDMRVVWSETHLVQHHASDVAVAVSVEGGLVTPIVRQAEKKSLRDLSKEMRYWIDKARQGKLTPEDYQGGVFTLSNLGMMGVDCFYPILNPPHAGILAIGTTREAPVAKDGQLSVAQVMTASLAADHRAVDGVCAAEFLTTFRSFIEQPYRLIF